MRQVLITGVGRGIGRALAERFLAAGEMVVGTTLSGEAPWSHECFKVVKLDLVSPESVAAAAQVISQIIPAIDILINNAGVLLDEEETAVVPDLLRQTLEINLIGTIDLTEQLLPRIKPGGHLLNISSSAGSLAETGHSSHFLGHYPAYKISKAALNMYTRTLALRVQGQFIVSAVHPGWVKTEMGGEEADLTPKVAAESIFNLAISQPETGQFWFKGEKFPW